jgi:hypothetical protein
MGKQTIQTTAPAHEDCCGCIQLTYVPDEDSWAVECNECLHLLGWGKTDWGNQDDRRRLAESTAQALGEIDHG